MCTVAAFVAVGTTLFSHSEGQRQQAKAERRAEEQKADAEKALAQRDTREADRIQTIKSAKDATNARRSRRKLGKKGLRTQPSALAGIGSQTPQAIAPPSLGGI